MLKYWDRVRVIDGFYKDYIGDVVGFNSVTDEYNISLTLSTYYDGRIPIDCAESHTEIHKFKEAELILM